jgi:hypothetical protein
MWRQDINEKLGSNLKSLSVYGAFISDVGDESAIFAAIMRIYHRNKCNCDTAEARSPLVSDLKSKCRDRKTRSLKKHRSRHLDSRHLILFAKNQIYFRSGETVKQSAIKMEKAFGKE